MSEPTHARSPRSHLELEALRRERIQLERDDERDACEVGARPYERRAAAPTPASALRYAETGGTLPLEQLLGGGTDGNRRLTSQTGLLLIVLLAIIGVTILRIGQLLSVHMFVGMLLIGPVALKLASTGYRFSRYYANSPSYRHAGPPPTLLRLIAPIVILSTVGVFATGIVLLLAGPGSRGTFVLLHKVFFIVWIAFTAVHVLAHIAELPGALSARGRRWAALDATAERYTEIAEQLPGMRRPVAPAAEPALDGYGTGRAGRAIAISGVLVAGLVLALVSISWYGPWLHSTVR
jgi:hypothetical protein